MLLRRKKLGATKQSEGYHPEMNWEALIGGDERAWDDDRARKCRRRTNQVTELLALCDQLEALGGCYIASPDVLRMLPQSVSYFLALAGYSQKSLNNAAQVVLPGGRTARAATLAASVGRGGRSVNDADLSAFARWLNAQIRAVIPEQPENRLHLVTSAAMIMGGKLVGQTQNEGGALAVEALQRYILELFPAADWAASGDDEGAELPEEPLVGTSVWLYRPTGKLVDFKAGGNRPDMLVKDGQAVSLVAEIKGRKDLSNAWESWMPQVGDHLRTWQQQYPSAIRGVIMTHITMDMVRGYSNPNVPRSGLSQLHESGLLNFVVNLSRLDQSESRTQLIGAMAAGLDAP